MNFTSKQNANVLILKLEGDLLGDTSGQPLFDIVDQSINDKIILCAIDISKIRYINSTGMGFLITILTKFRNKEGEVYLINPSKEVKKLLIITKLNAFFNITQTEKEAVKRLNEELKSNSQRTI